MATERFLLYIDILGFSEMSRSEPRKVARIYSILDSLNVHRHDLFKTIVFSDTVLVYNSTLATSKSIRDYLVWYLIEFAEDLHHRLTGQDVYFRSVITAGQFSHYSLQNIDCFFGEALIDAYLREKRIPSLGLFIDARCNQYNKYFRTRRFDDQLRFVYLNRSLETLHQYSGGVFPFGDPTLEDMTPHVPWQVRFLRDIHNQMKSHSDPLVRIKFLTAWEMYRSRYPSMLAALEGGGFSLSSLAGRRAWTSEAKKMRGDVKRFKRIGSGTPLSLQLSAKNSLVRRGLAKRKRKARTTR
ncbi:MAG: hypothetical protein ABI821_17395 [Pseudomonadota bacterium]